MEKTTLILGAGASLTYGYPLGSGLIEMIKTLARDGTHTMFADALDDARPHSIDSFLNDRKDLQEIGKKFIALAIARCERKNAPRTIPDKDNWYRNLYYSLSPEIDFEKLTIVSFNYDRSLEHHLAVMHAARKNISLADATQQLGAIRIFHPHGRLCPTEYESSAHPSKYAGKVNLPYGCAEEQRYHAAFFSYGPFIQTIYENSTKSSEIRSAILDSAHVIFLGFGFHELNMGQLGVDFNDRHSNIRGVYATIHQMSPVDSHQLRAEYRKIKFFDETCMSFFQNRFSIKHSKLHD